MTSLFVAGLLAVDWARGETVFDKFPWAWDLGVFLAGFGLIAVMVWFVMARPAGRGFVIHVDEEDITFTGKFPAQLQGMVIEFLRRDVGLAGAYEIRGHWEEGMLVVVVTGEQARGMEQRIRNFLKLNLKGPG